MRTNLPRAPSPSSARAVSEPRCTRVLALELRSHAPVLPNQFLGAANSQHNAQSVASRRCDAEHAPPLRERSEPSFHNEHATLRRSSPRPVSGDMIDWHIPGNKRRILDRATIVEQRLDSYSPRSCEHHPTGSSEGSGARASSVGSTIPRASSGSRAHRISRGRRSGIGRRGWLRDR